MEDDGVEKKSRRGRGREIERARRVVVSEKLKLVTNNDVGGTSENVSTPA